MEKKLTDSQRKMVEENYGLIQGFCTLHGINKNKYSDILSLALCESAMRYDETKGISFSSYAYRIMNNRMINEYRKEHAKTRIPSDMIVSVNSIDTEKYGNISSLYETIASAENVEEIAMYKYIINDMRTNEKFLTEKQKITLDCLILGLSIKESHYVINCTLRYAEKLREIVRYKIKNFIRNL